MRRLFRQFSFPGGIPSHVAPETPGSIHEGGELGYALAHAYGAALDNPDLLVACVIGDGEAETGPLAASWHSNKFLNPARDGAVLPILHLNGYKIANPTVLSRIAARRARRAADRLRLPRVVRRGRRAGGDAPGDGRRPGRDRRRDPRRSRPTRARRQYRAPALADDRAAHAEGLDRAEVDGSGRGHVRAHQVPLAGLRRDPEHLARARGVDALLPARGAVRRARPPAARGRRAGARRASGGWAPTRTPTAGCCCATSGCPTSASTPSTCPPRPRASSEATRVLGGWLRDVAARQRRHVPRLRPRRDRVEPARRRLRGDRPRLDGRDRCPPTSTLARTAA